MRQKDGLAFSREVGMALGLTRHTGAVLQPLHRASEQSRANKVKIKEYPIKKCSPLCPASSPHASSSQGPTASFPWCCQCFGDPGLGVRGRPAQGSRERRGEVEEELWQTVMGGHGIT